MRNKQSFLTDNRISVTLCGPNFDDYIEVVQECWYIDHRRAPIGQGQRSFRPCHVYINETKHKYGKTLAYALCTVWDYKNKKLVNIPLHRLVYLTFKGDIPEGYDVDHIDRDTLNNHPDNLRAISRKENIANRSGAKNQWYYIKKNKNRYETNDLIAEQND